MTVRVRWVETPDQKQELDWGPYEGNCVVDIQKDLDDFAQLLHSFEEPGNLLHIPLTSGCSQRSLYSVDGVLDVPQTACPELGALLLGQAHAKPRKSVSERFLGFHD